MHTTTDRWAAENCLPGIPLKRPVSVVSVDRLRVLPWALFAISCIFNLVLLVRLGLPQVHMLQEPFMRDMFGHVRSLVEAESGNSTHTSSAHDGGHQHDAMLFLFNALVIGTAVTHLTTMPAFSGLQHTVVVFVLGVLYSLIQEGLGFKEDTGVFGESYDMWMHIDPHLLLFALLPPLLAGDAMAIDTQIAKRVANQCLYLAGPGVVMSAMLTAGFFMFYLNWSFLLSLCTGAILCATDPVAVVALLKDLGASPTLTVQIQGESLINDGTAIVLFTVAYDMLKGENLDASDIVMYLIKTALMAFALGLVIGYVFYLWIRKASNRLDHRSSIIQISLTLCCAYWSFILAEGVLHISGVLATVAASLVLADKMWPHIVSQEAMHHVWHTFEALGNTVIFFLAGALTGNSMVRIDGVDVLNLFVIYFVLTFIRGFLIFSSRPLLKRLSSDGTDVTKASAAVMTWGGLRGAVGLALAIQVKLNRALDDNGEERISSKDADRVLFFVGGVAFLTLVINASTCPILVRALGISATPEAKKRILRMIHRQLVRHTKAKNYPKEVTDSLDRILMETVDHIDHDSAWSTKSSPTKEFLAADADGKKSLLHAVSKHLATDLDLAVGLHAIPHTISDDLNGVKPLSSTLPPPLWEECPLPCAVVETEDLPVKSEGCNYTDVHAMSKPESGSPSPSVHDDPLLMTQSEATEDGDISVVPALTASRPPRLDRMSSKLPKGSWRRSEGRLSTRFQASVESIAGMVTRFSVRRPANMEEVEAEKLVGELRHCRDEYRKIPQEDIDLLGELPEMFLRPLEHDLAKLVKSHAHDVDSEMQEAINGAYLHLVQSQYWKFIEQRDLIPGTKEADVLLISIQVSRSKDRTHLTDWNLILPHLDIQVRRGSLEDRGYRSEASGTGDLLRSDSQLPGWREQLISRLESAPCQTAIACGIVLNGVYIAIEESMRKDSNNDDIVWLVIEICFTSLFTLEFILNFIGRGFDYFRDGWNIFDFLLVVSGLFGIISSYAARGLEDVSGNADVSGEARLVRVARVFRVMRLLRLFRLVKFFQLLQAKLQRQEMSLEVAEHMQTMAILIGFIRAHLLSQQQFFRLLCGEEDQCRVCSVEVARCMLQSQMGVYRALRFAVARSGKLDKQNLTQVNNVKESKRITEELEHFILSAWETGVISAREAESVLHPLHDHIKQCMVLIKDTVRGVSRNLKEELVEGHHHRKTLLSLAHSVSWASLTGSRHNSVLMQGKISQGTEDEKQSDTILEIVRDETHEDAQC